MANTNNHNLSLTEQRSIFHPDEYHALDMFDERTARNRDRRLATSEQTAQPSRFKKAARTVLVAAGIAGAAYGIGRAASDEPTPVPRENKSFDYAGHGVQPNFVPKTPESHQK